MMNHTQVTEFFILGFPKRHHFKVPLFTIILTLYILTVVGNLLMITMVLANPQLYTPMYIFLINLSLSDIMLTSNIVPFMLYVTMNKMGIISLAGCISQFYIYAGSGSTECLLLTVMSYDRYLAVCKPLHYNHIMDLKLQLELVICSWFFSWTIPIISVTMLSLLNFCDSNIIDHFFCDFAPLLHVACSDISYVELEALLASLLLFLFPFAFVSITYIYIFHTILKIPSTCGKHKAFLTCSSHLTVVCTFYGTMITLYMVPSAVRSLEVTKSLSLLYAVVTPFLNPIVYSLRNKEIRSAVMKWIHHFRQ